MNNNNSVKLPEMLTRARKAFSSHTTRDVAFRKKQLRSLDSMLVENKELVIDALKKDLRKPKFETLLFEVEMVRNEIKSMLINMDQWTKDQPVSKTLMTFFDKSYIKYEPYGVVFIMGAWNYPLLLSLGPLVGAIASGNCAIVKPSELTPATARMISELLPRYLDKECYHAMIGGPEETEQALKEKFDYIFYTGGDRVGRIVYESAAKSLTPVTLEMGGKSPVYFDETVTDLLPAARRLMWAKTLNAGQTCIAPDYVLCTKQVQKVLLEKIPAVLKEFYADNTHQSEDFGRIVNENHFKRLIKLIEVNKDKIAIGGQYDPEDLYIQPTVMKNVGPNDSIMQEEIFGPILPIVIIDDLDDAIQFINSRAKPLALYVFSNNRESIKKISNQTSSGGLVINDIGVHLTVDELPFGGVGLSGIGRYHGRFTFETFSHRKAVLSRGWNSILEFIGSHRYPPYSNKKFNIMKLLLEKRTLFPPYLDYLVIFLAGMVTLMLVQSFVSRIQ